MKEKILSICQSMNDKVIDGVELLESGILDSYSIMEIIAELELEYEIEFPPEEIMNQENFQTIDNLVETVIRIQNFLGGGVI